MSHLEIVYNHIDPDKELCLQDLLKCSNVYLTVLSKADELNYGWIHVLENHRVVGEAQPFSISEFLRIVSVHFEQIVGGSVIWLEGLESSFVFRAMGANLEISFWRGIATQQLQPLISADLVPGLCFIMKCSIEKLPRDDRQPFQVQIPIRSWLETILRWGREFQELALNVKAELLTNPENEPEDVQEVMDFLVEFPAAESRIVAYLQGKPNQLSQLTSPTKG